MKVKIISLFPEIVESALKVGVIGRALKNNIWTLECINLKNFGPHIDNPPIGGGAGMIISPTVLEQALVNCNNIYFTSPRGVRFDQSMAQQLSIEKEITILCGRYEGIDQRIIDTYNIKEISIGEYILCGGEVAACVILEAVLRLIPKVLNNYESTVNESFSNYLVEHDHYTLPRIWNGISVPQELLSGNHQIIHNFQYFNALHRTYIHKHLWISYILYLNKYLVLFLFVSSIRKKVTFMKVIRSSV